MLKFKQIKNNYNWDLNLNYIIKKDSKKYFITYKSSQFGLKI